MNLVKKNYYLFLFLLGIGMVPLSAAERNPETNSAQNMLVPEEGDFLPDTVNVFHIAKDVSEIFIEAIGGTVYNDLGGDTAILNSIFNASYTSNDIGQAYKNAIDQQIKAQRGDIGLSLRGDYTENFTPGISVDEDLTFKRRFYVGLEWDIIKGGLFDAGNKIHQLKMKSILQEYEALELAEKENYRYLFNYINYVFNAQKIEVLKERKSLINKQLKFTKELYHLRYVGWEKVLKYQEKLEDIEHHVYQYKKFNKHIVSNIPDTLLTRGISAKDLPLFDVNLDSLMKIYYGHHSEDTVTQIKLAIYKDNMKWWKDITLKPFVRYNMYVNEFDLLRNYGSAGVSLKVPLRFYNKKKLIRSQEMVYESEQFKELESGDNELVNIYAEFGYKLKQIKSFYYKKMLIDELIRKELVKKEYHDVAFNPVYTLGLIDDKKAIEAEIIDLKKRMYINLVRLAFYLEDRTPTDFITLLQPSDFTGRYEGSIKMFVTVEDIKMNSPEGVVSYLWKNEFVDAIVENEGQDLSADLQVMLEKSKLANIFYTIMRSVPNDGIYPDVAADASQIQNWDNDRVIGLHYELDLFSSDEAINEASEIDISDWVSSISTEVVNGPIRLSIGIPSGLSISVLNRIFNKFDLVFVHEKGVPNIEKVKDLYATEMNLNADKFVLSLKGTDFADRIHLENYMSTLYNNSGLNNFAFSDFSSLMNVDFRTFEKGAEIDLQPGELVASVRNQIYIKEKEENAQPSYIKPTENVTEDNVEEVVQEEVVQEEVVQEEVVQEEVVQEEASTPESDMSNESVYRIQIASSKVQLSSEFLKRFNADDIRETKVNDYYKYTIGHYKNKKDALGGLEDYRSSSDNAGAFLVTY